MASGEVTKGENFSPLSDRQLSNDELLILSVLGKNKGFYSQLENEHKDRVDNEIYKENLRSGVEVQPGSFKASNSTRRKAEVDEARELAMSDLYGSGPIPANMGRGGESPIGGFAWAALLPMGIPLISEAIKGISGVIQAAIIKKKGSGSGSGIMPPNMQNFYRGFGAAFNRELSARRNRHEAIDSRLRTMRGPHFWKALTQDLHSEITDMLPRIGNFSRANASQIASAAIAKSLPPAFQKRIDVQVAQVSGSGPDQHSQLSSIVKPTVEYMLERIVEDISDPAISQKIDTELTHLDHEIEGSGPKWDKFKKGAKSFFSKVLKHGKRITRRILPEIANIAKSEISDAVDYASSKIRLPGNLSKELGSAINKEMPDVIDRLRDKISLGLAEETDDEPGPNPDGPNPQGSGFRRPPGMSVAKFNKLRREASYMADKFGPNAVKKHGKKLMSQGPEAMMTLGRYMNKKEPGYSNSDFHITNRLFAENIKNRYASGGASSSHPYEKNLTIGTKKKAFQVKIL